MTEAKKQMICKLSYAGLTTCHRCGATCRKNNLSKHLESRTCNKEMNILMNDLKHNIPELSITECNIPIETSDQKTSKRRLPDGSYNKQPLDPEYYKKYYHTRGAELINCIRCGVECRKNYLSKHMRTSKCDIAMNSFLKDLKNTIPNLLSDLV